MKPLTAQDPETKSPDIVAENIEQLKALFPEAFTEGQDGLRGAQAASWRNRG